ncbi:hypothetical protein ACIP79_06010 [Streptomyces sp. NPDC088747]|uniref:hypothetical protein n=1 Tax=Streptomyces sp. NPDC088747 TaxID=3365886 RepID=UPI0037FE32BE
MDITSLVIALSVVVIITSAFLSVVNEPPLWVYLLAGAGSLPLTAALLDTSALTSAVGDGFVGQWAVRFAVMSVVTAVLGFFVGHKSDDGADDDRTSDRRPSPHPTV